MATESSKSPAEGTPAPTPAVVAPAAVASSPEPAPKGYQADLADVVREIKAVDKKVETRLAAVPTPSTPAPSSPAKKSGGWGFVVGGLLLVAIAVAGVVVLALRKVKARKA